MYKWIIIGGGIHGCTVATFLIKSGEAQINELLIIDPHKEPLSRWKRNTNLIGMEYLRSPSVHHIDVNPFSLLKYGKDFKRKDFFGHYKRPSLALFNEHSESVLKKIGISKAWYQGQVNSVFKKEEGWCIQTSRCDEFVAKNIVIATGLYEQLEFPKWMNSIKGDLPNNIYHIFNEKLPELEHFNPPITVVGGGITAAHVSIKLSKLFPGKVTLLKRHDFRIHTFDSDPGWLGPKNLHAFDKMKNYSERRETIQMARNKGSITHELYRELLKLEREEKLTIINDEVDLVSSDTKGIILHLKTNTLKIKANTLLLATGFQPFPAKQPWLKMLIEEQNLPLAPCGYPIVSNSLEWSPHLYVSGPLAELEIGPVSKNISGARKVAERIVRSI